MPESLPILLVLTPGGTLVTVWKEDFRVNRIFALLN